MCDILAMKKERDIVIDLEELNRQLIEYKKKLTQIGDSL